MANIGRSGSLQNRRRDHDAVAESTKHGTFVANKCTSEARVDARATPGDTAAKLLNIGRG
jgi:hypothetical protein